MGSLTKISIRKFQSSDAQAIQVLISNIMNQEFPQSKAAYPLDDLLDIENVYGKDGEGFFVATNNEHIVGTVAVKREDERAALLRRVFVDPSHRRQKIGLSLIDHAIGFCKKHGYEEIIFRTASKMDGAIRLCQAKGFHQRAKLEMGGLELLKFVLFLDKDAALHNV